jgi:hypothetical protein
VLEAQILNSKVVKWGEIAVSSTMLKCGIRQYKQGYKVLSSNMNRDISLCVGKNPRVVGANTNRSRTTEKRIDK